MVTNILVGLMAYLIGSISFAVIISKKMAGFDVREKGSKGAGATNVLRTVGKKAAILTLVLDILKGVVTVLIAYGIGRAVKSENAALLIQIAAIAVVLGHTFPIYFGFKGGKGIATAIGILLLVNWQIGLICMIFGILIIALTKMVSAGSVAASILFPVLVPFIKNSFLVPGNYYLIFAIIMSCITVFNHRKNIKRILGGTESKLGEKVK